MAARKAPAGLARSGSALWSQVVGRWDLRPDELRVLEDACREADLIDTLNRTLVGDDVMVKGSMGQPVLNPLIAEIRQHRATLAGLLRGLKLPDDAASSEHGGELSAKNREAANARWSRRGA